jgi:glycosyltransferase involved in cell wall biosynthesis
MHVLVVTCAHRGDDARIVHRQARILLESGHQVTLISPRPPSTENDPAGLVRVAVPRAVGRRRVHAWCEVRREVKARWPATDLVLLHDPELVPLLARRWLNKPIVWDVHEDYVASVSDRTWIPGPLRSSAASAAARIEHSATRRCHLILAEDSYAARLGDHPVVPNSTWITPLPSVPVIDDPPRLVYIGRVSAGRGAHELIELGRRLRGIAVVELVGDADVDVRDAVDAAHDTGDIVWRGFVPNPVALDRLNGAFAGLSLLHNEPNYVHSRPTKLLEYLAAGIPFISTALPLADELAQQSRGGIIVRASVVDEVAEVVEGWINMPTERTACALSGHRHVAENYSWEHDGRLFVEQLEVWSSSPGSV